MQEQPTSNSLEVAQTGGNQPSATQGNYARRSRDAQLTRILIVDDEESILWALSQNLSLMNDTYAIGTATSAEEALSIMQTTRIDIVITDLRLPKMDGLAFAKLLRERAPHTRIIMMTAFGTDDIEKRAFAAGCYAYIEKPFSVEMLLRFLLSPDGEDRPEVCDDEPLPILNDEELWVRGPNSSPAPDRAMHKQRMRELLRMRSHRRPPKVLRDFTEDELSLAPEQNEPKYQHVLDSIFTDDTFTLLPEDASIIKQASERERKKHEQVRQLVRDGIDQFRSFRLADAEKTWARALEIDPHCEEARKNLRVLEKVLKTKTC